METEKEKNNYPAELGGDKERSVIYESKECMTAQAIDEFLNRDKYAYSYIYWAPQALGVIITLCKPNPKSFDQKYKRKIQRGLKELTESEAITTAKAYFSTMENKEFFETIETVLARLNENGYVLAQKVNEEKPQ